MVSLGHRSLETATLFVRKLVERPAERTGLLWTLSEAAPYAGIDGRVARGTFRLAATPLSDAPRRGDLRDQVQLGPIRVC